MRAFSRSDEEALSAGLPISGTRPTLVHARFLKVRQCLQGYLSRILLDACIKQALSRRGQEGPRTMEELASLVEEIMVGMRLFVDPSRLTELMIELSELLEDDTL